MYGRPSFLQQALLVALLGAMLMMFVAAISGAVALVLGLIFYFTWNHGAVGFVNGSLGGDVAGVTYWTAFFVTWFIGLVGTLVKGSQASTTSS